ncbi:FAD-dependent monooxygenase [Kitasatospora sp. NPDC051853]|uniref:FAD-dependent monooxygenase n=1 Tax=Kitasatospora sp. NPDC051853 TaxID=3364058 RepID=UPI00378A23C3
MTDRHALIAGAGIGGLTAAVALHRRGWRVTVCERAEAVSAVGAGIVLAPNALRALGTVGLGPAMATGQPLSGTAGLRRPDGRWLTRSDTAALTERYGLPARAVHRGFLVETLAAALPADALRTATTVTGASTGTGTGQDGDTAVLHTTTGDLHADVVIAADGIRSALRRQLFPGHPGPRHAGEAGWRAVVPGDGLDVRQASETWGRGERFGIVPLADGRIYLYATARSRPGTHTTDHVTGHVTDHATGRAADHRAELLRRFGGWHAPIPALLDRLDRIDPAAVLHHDFDELAVPLPRLHHGRVALLGDAAHAMTPNLGQGGCQAIEDAVVLAHLLDTTPDTPSALAAYSAARLARTTAVSRRSRRAGQLVGLTNPLAATLRDLAVRAAPPSLSLRAMDELYAWQPPGA